MGSKFEHSCFISYRHGSGELLLEFVDRLQKGLTDFLGMKLDLETCRDVDNLNGGDVLDPSLAYKLCKSVCMVVVYTQNYFSKEHLYCAREVMLMQELERKRFDLLTIPEKRRKSLIIPVVLDLPSSKQAKLPGPLGGKIYYDFSSYPLNPLKGKQPLRKRGLYAAHLNQIAQIARDWHDWFKNSNTDLCECCEELKLPPKEEALKLVEEIENPGPAFPFSG